MLSERYTKEIDTGATSHENDQEIEAGQGRTEERSITPIVDGSTERSESNHSVRGSQSAGILYDNFCL